MTSCGLCSFATHRCHVPSATWRSTAKTMRRLDFVCGPISLLGRQFDTWVDRTSDVSAKREDHFPSVLEIAWQPHLGERLPQWGQPILERRALVEGPAVAAFRATMAMYPHIPQGTPVDAHHALFWPGFYRTKLPFSFRFKTEHRRNPGSPRPHGTVCPYFMPGGRSSHKNNGGGARPFCGVFFRAGAHAC